MNPRSQTFLRFASLAVCLLVLGMRQGVSQQNPKELTLTLTNPLDMERLDEFVFVSEELLEKGFQNSVVQNFLVFNEAKEIPSQRIAGRDSKGLGFVLPKIGSKESLNIRIVSTPSPPNAPYTKRTQAEISHKVGGVFKDRKYEGGHFENVQSLRVPVDHTDHSWFIRYEGPGWESDLVAYRFYLDWRNGIDVFGKKTPEMVLQNVGQDGFDSYHEPADWGMDVLKVGKTLGLGSIATWEDGKARRIDVTDSLYAEITNNGVVYSSVLTKYQGWDLPSGKTDIHSEISIHAGTRLSEIRLIASAPLPNFATGLIKDPKAEVLKSDSDLPFSYLATYGEQSLAGDKLGIAVIYPTSKLKELTEDELSHVLVFGSQDQKLSYYILAAWEQEKGGIQSKAEFEQYLNDEIKKLSFPLTVSY